MNAVEAGRDALVAWRAAWPQNWFDSDAHLGSLLKRLWGEDRFEAERSAFSAHGADLAVRLDPIVIEMERRWNLPRLERWDGIGRRTEDVTYDGRYREVGQALYGAGVVARLDEPGSMLRSAALGYLQNQLGEAGHNCPIACTMGLVRALVDAGSDELKARYLPGLLETDYDRKLSGAQFMTEVQGGSDVGANAVVATPAGDGSWRINGEKWFCSNASADLILMTARPDGAAEGTRGLGLFLVPRRLPDGSLNGFYLRRLKEKVGTRAMASGEMDFVDCVGWSVGPVEDGFKTMMNNVINTSRLCNASGTLAMARRAYSIAWTYAGHRTAFGQPIRRYPLIRETLADMRTENEVLLAGHLHLASVRDRLDVGDEREHDAGYYRVALNLNKYRTSVSAGEVIRRGLEILGGNGTIESFSPIPRLLRDNVVYENWEGSHNTLAMQVLRDMGRLGVGRDFCASLAGRWSAISGALGARAERGLAAVQALSGQLEELACVDPGLASLRMRPLADHMSWLMAATAFAEHVPAVPQSDARAVLDHFWRRRLATPPELPDSATMDAITGLAEVH